MNGLFAFSYIKLRVPNFKNDLSSLQNIQYIGGFSKNLETDCITYVVYYVNWKANYAERIDK